MAPASPEERGELARAQASLVAALTSPGPPPPGFDPARLRAAADALAAKRAHVVARSCPALVGVLRGDFRARFDDYAASHPVSSGGAAHEVLGFLRWLTAPVGAPDALRRLYLLQRLRLGTPVAAAWLHEARCLLLGARVPRLGVRVASIRLSRPAAPSVRRRPPSSGGWSASET